MHFELETGNLRGLDHSHHSFLHSWVNKQQRSSIRTKHFACFVKLNNTYANFTQKISQENAYGRLKHSILFMLKHKREESTTNFTRKTEVI